MLFIKIFSTTVITLIISLKALFSQMSALNYEISSLVRPNWEYESFWAIPRIGKTKPLVAISLLAGKNTVNVRCIDIEYLEIKKIVKDNRVLSVSLDPMVAVMNDINVIDGYHTLYPLKYKKEFRKIIQEELKKVIAEYSV